MNRRALAAAVLFAAALALRLAAIARQPSYTGDEAMHVPAAFAYAEEGWLGADNWYHPPLKHLLTRAGVALCGDGPAGWRIRNVVTGAGTVVLVLLLGEALTGALAVGVTAALLVALDPLHLAMSRSTFEDVPAVFCLVAGVLLAVRARARQSTVALWGAGAAFGLAVALRLWAAAPLAAAGLALSTDALRRRRPAALLDVLAALGAVPAAIYLAAWIPWFRRGYGLAEWLSLQRLAVETAVSASSFDPVLLRLGHPARWFVQLVGVAFPAGAPGAHVVLANDPPVWALAVPGVLAAGVVAWRERNWRLAVVPAAFACLYVPFLLARRPIFLYSALAPLPFALVGVAFVAHRLLGRWLPVFVAAAIAWGAWLYPLAVGAPAPPGRYEAILSRVGAP